MLWLKVALAYFACGCCELNSGVIKTFAIYWPATGLPLTSTTALKVWISLYAAPSVVKNVAELLNSIPTEISKKFPAVVTTFIAIPF